MLRSRPVKTLQMAAPSAPGRPAHVSAASGLVRVGGTLYVVADDETLLASIPAETDAPGGWHSLLPGELPLGYAERKARKPDLEALTLVPGHPGFLHGALLAVPSGSTPRRRTAALVPLDPRGLPLAPRSIDLGPLYGALGAHFPALNVEGAAVVGASLVLLQRGNGAGGRNALVLLDLPPVLEALAGARAIAPDALREIRPVELGTLAGVPLTFTDASPLPDGRLAFAAAAEDTADTYNDGPCLGSAVGVMDLEGRVHRVEPLDCPEKLEGIHATPQGSGLGLLLVSDADDAAVPAVLREALL